MAPLWQLCSEGKLEKVRVALRGGEDVNSSRDEEDNRTALMWAVGNNHNGIVKLLLQQPAIRVNDRSRLNTGMTALHIAAFYNNVEAMRLLFENQQIEVNCQNNYGRAALHNAADNNNVEAMRQLLENEQVDVNLKDKEGNTALLYCYTVETIQLLLANQQVDVNAANNYGETGLHVAAQEDDVEMIRMLLAHPQFNSANHVNAEGNTPAMLAAAHQNGDALRELVNHQSVDLDILDGDGRSLNQIAAWDQGVAIIREASQSRARQAEEELNKQRRRRHEMERATAKVVEKEELRRRQEEKVQAAIKRNEEKKEKVVNENKETEEKVLRQNKEREEKVLRQNKEREEKVLRENNEKEEKVLKENKESLALLLEENKAELAALEEKQEKADRAARKRKADGPVAPECPVCLTEMRPPTRIFQCLNGHHVCETCKSSLNEVICPKCRASIIGRASDMENFLMENLA